MSTLRNMLEDAGFEHGKDFSIDQDHVIAIDVSCSCGERLTGAWSGEEVDSWHESHRVQGEEETT